MNRNLLLSIAILLMIMIPACAASYYNQNEARESLVLQDGAEIPCQIVDYDAYNLYIEPIKSSDLYQYSDVIPIGNVATVHLQRGSETLSFPVDDYLVKYFGRTGNEAMQAEPDQPESADEAASTQSSHSSGNVGVNVSPYFSDSTASKRATGVGLDLTGAFTPEPEERPIAYGEIADLIVSAGATGLVLYRAEKNQEAGIEVSDAQSELVSAIHESQLWSERKKGLRNAHRIASAAFAQAQPEALENRFGFESPKSGDAFIQFLIFLRKQGDLRAPVKVDNAVALFGEQATAAIQDLLANFDDWYYIVVMKLEK